MPYKRIRIEPDDTEGNALRAKFEDMTGQTVAIRMEDGTEVEGHVVRRGEDMTGEDAEGHGLRIRSIDLEVDDTTANMLRAATDKGEPVYVRFPDEDDVQGHAYRIKS